MLMQFGSLILERIQEGYDYHSFVSQGIDYKQRPGFEMKIRGSFMTLDPISQNNPESLKAWFARGIAVRLIFRKGGGSRIYKLPDGLELTKEDEEWCKEFGIGEYTKTEVEEVIITSATITRFDLLGRTEFECDGRMEQRKL